VTAGDPRAHANATLAAILAMQAEIDDALVQSAADDARREAEFSAHARVGKLGTEWQRVQQRIDLGETTLDDVMSGVDDSPSARALRERAEATLEVVHDELELDEEPEKVDTLAEMNEMQRDLAKRLDELRMMAEELDGRR
jgi:hypothetical protein